MAVHVDSVTGKQTIIRMNDLNRMVEITSGLFQSGTPGTAFGPTYDQIAEAGIDVVVNIGGQGRAPLRGGMLFIAWLIDDEPSLRDKAVWHHMAVFITELLACNKRVLLHCEAGLNRSCLLAGLVIRERLAVTGSDAISRIRSIRSPDALCNSTYERFLRNG